MLPKTQNDVLLGFWWSSRINLTRIFPEILSTINLRIVWNMEFQVNWPMSTN